MRHSEVVSGPNALLRLEDALSCEESGVPAGIAHRNELKGRASES